MEGSTLPPYVTAAFADIQGKAEALVAEAWPVMLFIFGAMVLMKIFKKFANRAAS